MGARRTNANNVTESREKAQRCVNVGNNTYSLDILLPYQQHLSSLCSSFPCFVLNNEGHLISKEKE